MDKQLIIRFLLSTKFRAFCVLKISSTTLLCENIIPFGVPFVLDVYIIVAKPAGCIAAFNVVISASKLVFFLISKKASQL